MTEFSIPDTRLSDATLYLRPWDPQSETDVAAWLAGTNDAEFGRWNTPDRTITSPAEARESLQRRESAWRDATAASFCVTDRADGTILGHIAINAIAWNMLRAQVGFWLLPEARGRHLSARALDLAALWAFDTLGLHRLELYHAVGNEASCRIAERCRFEHEGVLRDRMFESGERERFRDAHLHARLASDLRGRA